MRAQFDALASALAAAAKPGEHLMLWFTGEASDFVRFNQGRVRQPGHVRQAFTDVTLVRDERVVEEHVALTGDVPRDLETLARALKQLRERVAHVPQDPHVLFATESAHTERADSTPQTPAESVIDEVTRAAGNHDLVGIYAGGPVYRGFANSLGQRNWHETTTFSFDYCLYHARDKAVKTSLSGSAWDARQFAQSLTSAADRLAKLAVPEKPLEPGEYRAYLAPAAFSEVVDMMCWDGFGYRAIATKQSPLARLHARDGRLDPRVTVIEDIANGTAPAFQSEGFIKPERVRLIEGGEFREPLVSPRTARQYDIPSTGSNAAEVPESLDVAGGALATQDALDALDTGLYISNLWYCNFSDRTQGHITGLTRFATFWVEGGRIVAPAPVMRFDDSLYRMLGSALSDLTREREQLADTGTYLQRSTGSRRVPGAVLTQFRLTL